MNARNIAVVMGPTMFRGSDESVREVRCVETWREFGLGTLMDNLGFGNWPVTSAVDRALHLESRGPIFEGQKQILQGRILLLIANFAIKEASVLKAQVNINKVPPASKEKLSVTLMTN